MCTVVELSGGEAGGARAGFVVNRLIIILDSYGSEVEELAARWFGTVHSVRQ
jgi:hypothetical protein